MNYFRSLMQEFIFFSSDVQTTTIAIAVTSSLCCSIVLLVVNLMTGEHCRWLHLTARTTPRKKTAEQDGRKVSVVSFHFNRRFSYYHRPGCTGRSTTRPCRPTGWCRQVTRQYSLLCEGCGKRKADKPCHHLLCSQCCQANRNTVCDHHGNGTTAAQGLVEGACQDKPKDIDLSYLKLRQCPDRVGYIGAQLTSLNLSNNHLSCLPDEVGCLLGLEELFLQYNCLSCLPESLGNLKRLNELDVKNNHLTKLPDSIGNLGQLAFLRVTNNCLETFPHSIGNLHELQEISAHSNELKELPDELCQLSKLTVLHLGENKLERIPHNMGNLVRLAELDMSSCQLTALPMSICRCTALVKLWLSSNRLASLPGQLGRLHQLKELYVQHNRIKYFPASLACLQLYSFNASDNLLLEEGQDHQVAAVSVKPGQSLPSLVELAARVVCKHVSWRTENIPQNLQAMLEGVRWCSCCEGPFFTFYQSMLTFRSFGVYSKLPLYQQICSPYKNFRCQPVPMGQ